MVSDLCDLWKFLHCNVRLFLTDAYMFDKILMNNFTPSKFYNKNCKLFFGSHGNFTIHCKLQSPKYFLEKEGRRKVGSRVVKAKFRKLWTGRFGWLAEVPGTQRKTQRINTRGIIQEKNPLPLHANRKLLNESLLHRSSVREWERRWWRFSFCRGDGY